MLLPLLWVVLTQIPDTGAAEPSSLARELVDHTSETEYVDELLDDGRYVRFGTKDNGPVHVWRPRHYNPATGATVVYVHGFYTDVDQAMREHRLTTQFRDSARNALFVVPETRSGRNDDLFWPDLEKLLVAVEKRLRLSRPKGPLVVVGHSGGYRNIVSWLSHKHISQVMLVDGLYGNDVEFRQWVESFSSAQRQLILVGFETQQRAEWLLHKNAAAIQLDTLPWLYDELSPKVRKAPLVSVQSERLDHMQLVTDGRILPWLLHTFR